MPLTPQERLQLESELYRRDFKTFVGIAWKWVCSNKLVWELPQQAIALHLQAARDGKFPPNHTLLLQVPPGQSKSLLTTVLYPAWVWAKDPSQSFICSTHTSALTQRFASKFRGLVESYWYKSHFDVELADDTNAKLAMRNQHMGERLGVSVGGSITGSHADTHICDDLVDVSDTASLPALKAANDWYDGVLSTRFKDATNTSSIVIAQRLAPADIMGHLESRPDTVNLCLPATLEGNPCVTPIWTDPRCPGELLAPKRLPQAVLDLRKIALGSHNYEAQYLQRPTPLAGGIVRDIWLQHAFDALPRMRIALIVDCANTGLDDPTCILTVGVSQAKLYILDCITQCMDFPTLLNQLQLAKAKYNPFEVCIEAASSGHAAIQTLRQYHSNVIPLKPIGSKIERMMGATPSLESGSVLFPPNAPWLPDFRSEVTRFPLAIHDERVDCLAYAINRYLVQNNTSAIYAGYAAAAKN